MHFEFTRKDAIQGVVVLFTTYICQSSYFVTLEIPVVNAVTKGIVAVVNAAVCVLMIIQLNQNIFALEVNISHAIEHQITALKDALDSKIQMLR
jgi:hypothetical protein